TTIPQPTNRARTRFRAGSRTSLPRKVIFVHAVWAKTGPTIDFPKRRASARPPAKLNPGWAICGVHPLAHESHHEDVRAALVALQPRKIPTRTTPISAAVLAKVKMFCTRVPSLRPRV